jgi:tRNA(His) 5'-end guanylyltransferase
MSITGLYHYDGDRTIFDVLKTSKMTDEVGSYIPYQIIGKKSIWNKLGDFLRNAESQIIEKIDPKSWYTLRLDGRHFSRIVKKMSSDGILCKGYSMTFENIMKESVKDLFENGFYRVMAFTQSDEVILLFKPATMRFIDGDKKAMNFNLDGRLIKYTTHASSFLSSRFTYHLMKAMIVEGNMNLFHLIPAIEFDCRIAQFNSFEAALQLFLFRGYDCNVNGISSGIYMTQDLKDKKNLTCLNTGEKLKFLHDNGILETMSQHRLYGTLFYRTILYEDKFVPCLNRSIRKRIITTNEISYPIISLIYHGSLVYSEEINEIDRISI